MAVLDPFAFERAVEFRILGLAARAPFNGDALPELDALTCGTVDWPQLAKGAQRHRLVGPLLNSARAGGWIDRIDRDVRQQLEERERRNAIRSLDLTALMVRLAAALAEAGIDALFLKGPALSQRLYSRLDMRGSGDIDLLVAPDHFDAAAALLSGLGIVPLTPAAAFRSPAARRSWIMQHHEDFFRDTRHGILIELHRRLTLNPRLLNWDFATLWQERAVVVLGEKPIAVLSDRHESVYLLAHGISHGWERLRWLADLALLTRTPEGCAIALETAAATDMQPAMLHMFGLARHWLGAPLPQEAAAGLTASPMARGMIAMARTAYTDEEKASGLAFMRSRAARYLLRQMLVNRLDYRLHDLRLGVCRFLASCQKAPRTGMRR